MSLEIQIKIKENPNYLRYLREHSEWYKILNRNPNLFKTFEDQVKDIYKLKITDRVEKALDTIDLVQKILTTIK